MTFWWNGDNPLQVVAAPLVLFVECSNERTSLCSCAVAVVVVVVVVVVIEIKLALTKEGWSDDVRKVIKGLKERNVNGAAAANQLWEFWKKCVKDVNLSISPFSSDERKEVSSLLLERLKEEKEGKEIAAVLAVCFLVMWYDVGMRTSLIEGGLAAPLVEIINSHRDQVDVVERGLWAAGALAWENGKQCIDCEEDVVVFVVKSAPPECSFHFICSLQLMVWSS